MCWREGVLWSALCEEVLLVLPGVGKEVLCVYAHGEDCFILGWEDPVSDFREGQILRSLSGGKGVCIYSFGDFACLFLSGEGLCIASWWNCLYVYLLGQEEGRGYPPLQQLFSAQPRAAFPPAGPTPPRAPPACCHHKRVPTPWIRAPLATAARSAATPAVSGISAAEASADVEHFLPRIEVKKP